MICIWLCCRIETIAAELIMFFYLKRDEKMVLSIMGPLPHYAVIILDRMQNWGKFWLSRQRSGIFSKGSKKSDCVHSGAKKKRQKKNHTHIFNHRNIYCIVLLYCIVSLISNWQIDWITFNYVQIKLSEMSSND